MRKDKTIIKPVEATEITGMHTTEITEIFNIPGGKEERLCWQHSIGSRLDGRK